MRIKQIVFYTYVISGLIAIMAGCNANNSREKDEQLALIQQTNPTPVTLVSNEKEEDFASKIEKHVEDIEEIYDVAVIKGKKETLIAYKVKHMQRFHMKGIEKELNSMLEKEFPKEDFIVSSDYKIFLEAVKLSNNMKDPQYSEKKAHKELERIIKLKKELT